jgi:hypothetical protein
LFWPFAFGAASASAPTHGRFGGSPEPETGESPAAAIFVFQFSIFIFGLSAGAQVRFASLPRRVRFRVSPPNFSERSSTARIRARHARDTGSTPVARSNSRRVVQRQNEPRLQALQCGVEQRQLIWLITRRPWVRVPSPRPSRRDSKGSPCAPLKPATSGCDPWSRRHLPISFKCFWQLAIRVNAPLC